MASMSLKPDANDEESFIILGSSPGTSLDLKCNGIGPSLDRSTLDDAIKDLSDEASNAFKAHFHLNEGPSPASLMVASTIITDDKSTEELQKQFGELLDENVILKETLKKNNDSMKEQFLMIASCQEDMMKTHVLHKEKFDETRELVEKLRQENKKLKLDLARLADPDQKSSVGASTSGSGEPSSGPMSALEFVTSPEDDTINKLTAQLELVEKQRRQVIVDNEKLTWQKESLERILDATSKERDDLKEKVYDLESRLSSIEGDYTERIQLLNKTIADLTSKLESANQTMSSMSTGELSKRDAVIRQLESKVSTLQSELKTAQLKVLNAEDIKLELIQFKSGVSDTLKRYQEQIQELQNKLKESQTIMFHPVRLSVGSEAEVSGSSENAKFMSNVKLYDTTLKHLAELLNQLTHGSTDSLVECLGVVASLHDFKLDRGNADQVKTSLIELRKRLDKLHNTALSNIGQVRSLLAIFEDIFKDHNEILKKLLTTPEVPKPAQSVEQLAAALVARGQEVQNLQSEVLALSNLKEDTELMKAQLELYKSDFEAERSSREKMASEKESLLADLRTTQRRNQGLLLQLEELRKQKSSAPQASGGPSSRPGGGGGGAGGGTSAGAPRPPGVGERPLAGNRRQSAPGSGTGNTVFKCPKCLRFSSNDYKAMEDHFDFCLDDF